MKLIRPHHPCTAFLVALSALSCSGKADDEPSGSETDNTPLDTGGEAEDDWSHLVEDDVHAATWAPEEVAGYIESVFAKGYPRAQDVVADYFQLLTYADETCPGSDVFTNGFQNLTGCTTAEGYFFQGAAGLLIQDYRVLPETGIWSGTYYIQTQPADYAIYRPDGTSLQSGGVFSLKMESDGSILSYWCHMTGTYEDDASTNWLHDSFSGNLDTQGVKNGDEYTETIDGFMSIGGVALELEQVLIDTRISETAPVGGRISLRQADSTWYDLELDADGSGCGQLSWDGVEELGELCVDLHLLVESTRTIWVI